MVPEDPRNTSFMTVLYLQGVWECQILKVGQILPSRLRCAAALQGHISEEEIDVSGEEDKCVELLRLQRDACTVRPLVIYLLNTAYGCVLWFGLPLQERVAWIFSSSTTTLSRWVMSPANRKIFIVSRTQRCQTTDPWNVRHNRWSAHTAKGLTESKKCDRLPNNIGSNMHAYTDRVVCSGQTRQALPWALAVVIAVKKKTVHHINAGFCYLCWFLLSLH